MSYELFREINTVLPLLAFGALMFRTVKSWPAEWAKPDHVIHYRLLLCVIAIYVLLSSLSAISHELAHTQATWVSPAYTAQSVFVLLVTRFWPVRKVRNVK